MRILVVCGAGASSTFVAQRVRRAAQERGLAYTAFAGTEQSLPIDLDTADMVLVGPHLADSFAIVERAAADRGVISVLLPDDVFADRSGERTLELVQSALAAHPSASADGTPAAS
jgi:cellobiose PTS system EIIB component